MAISQDLLNILCCPETKEDVHLISDDDIIRINKAITSGRVLQRDGTAVSGEIDSGLLREDGKYLYPIRENIPIMLIEEAIDMSTVL